MYFPHWRKPYEGQRCAEVPQVSRTHQRGATLIDAQLAVAWTNFVMSSYGQLRYYLTEHDLEHAPTSEGWEHEWTRIYEIVRSCGLSIQLVY